MKVYIVIQTEEYESGFTIHKVCSSKELALKVIEGIITSDIWKDDGWEYNSFAENWISERGNRLEIEECELLEE